MEAAVHLGPDARSVGAARRFVATTLGAWHGDGLVETAVLLTSELVTNAVRHARTPLSVRLQGDASRIRVAVTDAGGDQPALRLSRFPSEGGRGLALVSAMASDWGVEAEEGKGKTVWFVLESAHG